VLWVHNGPVQEPDGWEWKRRGVCAQPGADPDLMFPKGVGAQRRAATEVCPRCPVRTTCLTYSIETEQPYGVWGGMTEQDRRRLLAPKRRRAA
jgi:WhiB family redox-sensing transcriptional regulator